MHIAYFTAHATIVTNTNKNFHALVHRPAWINRSTNPISYPNRIKNHQFFNTTLNNIDEKKTVDYPRKVRAYISASYQISIHKTTRTYQNNTNTICIHPQTHTHSPVNERPFGAELSRIFPRLPQCWVGYPCPPCKDDNKLVGGS